jgi:hypothetical protein
MYSFIQSESISNINGHVKYQTYDEANINGHKYHDEMNETCNINDLNTLINKHSMKLRKNMNALKHKYPTILNTTPMLPSIEHENQDRTPKNIPRLKEIQRLHGGFDIHVITSTIIMIIIIITLIIIVIYIHEKYNNDSFE